MRILITGGSGLLGLKVSEKALENGDEVYSGFNTHFPKFGTPIKLDLCGRRALERIFMDVKPEVVIHTAALTDVDRCEEDRELAKRVNVEGTRNITELSSRYGSFLIHISTDYVFSGEKGMYREDDKKGPVNYYGVTKLEAEKNVEAMMDEWCIARPSVIYGSAPAAGKVNFALWVLEKLRKKEQISIVTDQYVSPTLNTSLGEMILEMAEKRLMGIYHLAGATAINRYDFACLLATVFRLDKDLIMPVKSEDMKWKAKRPMNTSLNVEKAAKTLVNKPVKIEEALNLLKKEITQ